MVLAAGLDTARLVPELPLAPRSGQLIITERDRQNRHLKGAITSACYLLDKTGRRAERDNPPFVIDPLETGQLLIGSSREDKGDSSSTDFLTVKRLLTHAARCFPPLLTQRVLRVFAGVRAAVADGKPIVGALSGNPRIVVATGFEGDGICLAPVVGREVANLVCGGMPCPEFSALTPDRFFRNRLAI